MLKKVLKGLCIYSAISWTVYGISNSVLTEIKAKKDGKEVEHRCILLDAIDNVKNIISILKES